MNASHRPPIQRGRLFAHTESRPPLALPGPFLFCFVPGRSRRLRSWEAEAEEHPEVLTPLPHCHPQRDQLGRSDTRAQEPRRTETAALLWFLSALGSCCAPSQVGLNFGSPLHPTQGLSGAKHGQPIQLEGILSLSLSCLRQSFKKYTKGMRKLSGSPGLPRKLDNIKINKSGDKGEDLQGSPKIWAAAAVARRRVCCSNESSNPESRCRKSRVSVWGSGCT